MIARPAISVWTFGASADRTEPAQKIPAPISMTFLRPNSSLTMPNASIAAANVSAYALITHCSELTPAFSPTCTAPRPTLTIVLSRNVRNRIVHSTPSATARPPWRAVGACSGTPTERTTGLGRRLADSGRRPAVLQRQQDAEARVTHLPGAVLEHRDALGVRQPGHGRAEQQDRVGHRGLGRRGERHLRDRGAGRGRPREAGRGLDGRGERLPVLDQADPLGHRGLRVEERDPVGRYLSDGGAARCGRW